MSKIHLSKFFFYLICFILYVGAYIWTVILYGFDITRFLYLSMINLFSNIFYTFMMMGMMIFSEKIHNKYSKKLESYFYKVNFCFSFTTYCIYWAIVSIDVNLLQKKSIPVTLNLFLHGGIFLLLLLDHFLISKKHYTTKIGISFLLYFYAIYSVIAFTLHFFLDFSLYPIINTINLIEYVFLTLGYFCVSTISLFIYRLFLDLKNERFFDEEEISFYQNID
jgi:hypothetical protein